MRKGVFALLLVIATSVASGTLGQTPQPSLAPVLLGSLPPQIRAELEEVGRECQGTPSEFASMYAYKLDVNSDDHTDFIYFPGYGLRSFPQGRAGYCSANWLPTIIAVYDGRGAYKDVVLGTGEGILVGHGETLFITQCTGSWEKFGGRQLGVLDTSRMKVVGFGKCHASLDAATAEAAKRGYRVPHFLNPRLSAGSR